MPLRRVARQKKIGSFIGLSILFCGLYLSSNSNVAGSDRSPASSYSENYEQDSRARGQELMTDDQKKRKIEVCGERSLESDSVSNFESQSTGYFPGRAKILADSHEALLVKLLLIEQAKKSVDISTYIFTPDETAKAILDELRMAILRGVNVRFMIDGGGSIAETVTDQYRHLRALLLARKEMVKSGLNPGTVDIVIFHPLGRPRTLLSNLKDRLIDEVDISSETALNWNRRSHDKILLVDKESREDAVAIVGGRNIDNHYFAYPAKDDGTYADLEVLLMNDPRSRDPRTLENTLGKHYQNLFCSKGNAWINLKDLGEPVEDSILGYWANSFSRKATIHIEGAAARLEEDPILKDLYARMKGRGGADYAKQGLVNVYLSPGNEIQNLKRRGTDVFVDPNAPFVEKLFNGDSIYQQIRGLIHNAEKSIDICTPYLFIPRNERECMKKWVMEKPGRTIRILSSSKATSDSALTLTSFELESAPELLKEGPYRCVDPITHKISEGMFNNQDSKIQVYQFGRLNNRIFNKGKIRDHLGRLVHPNEFYGKLHAKFGVIDGKYSFIGSHNLDQRSRRLNSETAFFIASPKIGADTTGFFDSLIQKSYLYGDPDLQLMNEREELGTRKTVMSILDFIMKRFPEAGFAN
ncbi:MAG: phospholipase D-like domain-containing protein [Bdellovibrionia bacterium]